MATVSMGLRSRATALDTIQKATFDKKAATFALQSNALAAAVYLDFIATQMDTLVRAQSFLDIDKYATVNMLHGVDIHEHPQQRYTFLLNTSHQPSINTRPKHNNGNPFVGDFGISDWAVLLAEGASPIQREKMGLAFYPDDVIGDLAIKAITHATQLGQTPLRRAPEALRIALLEREPGYTLPPWVDTVANQMRGTLNRAITRHIAVGELFQQAKTANHIVGVLPHAIHYLDTAVVGRMMASEKTVTADHRAFDKLKLSDCVNNAISNAISNSLPWSEQVHTWQDDATIRALYQEADDDLKAIKTQETINQLMQRK